MGLFNNWKKLVEGFPSALDWNRYTKAVAGMRGQNGIRVYLQNGEAVIEAVEQYLLDWTVYKTSATSFSVRSGFVMLHDGQTRKTYDGYTETISATRYVYAKYNRGYISGDYTPGWVTVSESGGVRYFQTGSTLPSDSGPLSDQYSIFHIATVNFADGQITSIVQNFSGGVIPCPDTMPQGTVMHIDQPDGTVIYGWHQLTGAYGFPDARDAFLIGSSGTKARRSTGGSTTLPFSTTGVQSGGGATVVDGQIGPALPPYVAFPIYRHL